MVKYIDWGIAVKFTETGGAAEKFTETLWQCPSLCIAPSLQTSSVI